MVADWSGEVSMKRLWFVLEAQLLLLLLPRQAFAHPMKGVGDFYAGMLHPVTTMDCILPMIALGLLAGQQGRRTAIGVLGSFPLASMVGALLSLAAPFSRYSVVFNEAAMILLGVLVAICRRLPTYVSVCLSVSLGLTIGWTNGSELTPDTSPYRFIPGLALVCLLSIAYGIGLVRSLNIPWTQIGVRVVGSWIAAVGILASGLK
jgi:urease accessory protein